MAFIFNASKIRMAVLVGLTRDLLGANDSESPEIFAGTDIRFELGFFRQIANNGQELIDPSNFATIRLEIKDKDDRNAPALIDKVIANTAINAGLTEEQWDDGSDQHVLIPLTFSETNLDLQQKTSKVFWLVISAITTDATPARLTLGATEITFIEDGTDGGAPSLSTPVGSNLIPPASVYDVAGHFDVAVEAGKTYRYNPGVNEVTLTNGSEVYAAQSIFIAVASTVQLLGIAPANAVTGSIQHPIVYTADEADARFGSGFLKTVNDPGVTGSFRSLNGRFIRTSGVDDNGNKFDEVTELTNP